MTVVAKLVRDKIPDIIRQDGREPVVSTISGAELAEALNRKLAEECQEFFAARDNAARLEELADVLEVIFGITQQIGYAKQDLFDACDAKRESRGGFTQGVFFAGYK